MKTLVEMFPKRPLSEIGYVQLFKESNKYKVMPKVGKKEFPYTKAGVKSAKKVAKATGKKMMMDKKMMKKMK